MKMDLRDNRITVSEILANPKAKAILRRELPALMDSPVLQFAGGMSLGNVLKIAHGNLPQPKIQRILQQLKEI